MSRWRKFALSLVAGLAAILVTASPAMAAGSVYLTDPGPTYAPAKYTFYTSANLSTTQAGTITNVYYSYANSYPKPTGLIVQLCDTTAHTCQVVTSAGSGYLATWNGRPSTDVFRYQLYVDNSSYTGGFYILTKTVTIFWS